MALRDREGGSVLLQWVPAHRGIEGNERADRLAKEAIEEESLCNLPNPPNFPNPPNYDISKAQRYQQRFAEPTDKMVLRVTGKTFQSQLDKIWKEVRTSRPLGTQHIGVYTWQLDGALPGPHITAVYNALTAAEASILSQCRTGHSRLRSNLHRMKVSNTAGCECGATRETITHVIYECPLLQEDRQAAIEVIGHRWRDLSYILGGWNPWEDPKTGQPVDGPKKKWKADLPAVKAVLHFLCKTGRFTWQTKEAG
jgi:hypothetical protein